MEPRECHGERIDGEHYYNKNTRAVVLSMSAATIDR